MYVASIQRLNYKNLKKQFAVYDSDTPVTLKQDQGHETCYDLIDPKQGYNHATFKKLQRFP